MGDEFPRSPYDREGGLFYFPRLVHKIRLHQRGELPAEYHANLGRGFDQRCCEFLHVAYDDLAAQVRAETDDAALLEWCFRNGRRATEAEIFMWNEYIRKCGWRDEYAERLRTRLAGLGMAGRTDVETMFDLIEVDEGRPPRGGSV